MTLPVLQLKGTPYEQGMQHGRLLRDQIDHNLDVYFHRFLHDSRLDRSEVLRRARLYGPRIAEQDLDYYEGMEGIAAGCGRTLDEIVALNVRYEIIYYQSVVNARERWSEGCTAFAIQPEASTNGHLMIGQNWDWIPRVLGAILLTTESNGMQTMAFSEAGIFGGKIGLNSAGLGLAVNGLTSEADDWMRLSKPYHVRCYEILRERDIEAALFRLTESSRGCSANFLVAVAPNQALDVETAPDATRSLQPSSGFIVHTNHFLDPDELGITEPPSDRRCYSYLRYERMEQLLRSEEKVTVEALKRYLQNHDDAPVSICRHEDPDAPVADQYRTVTSVIMDLQDRTMLITDGPPCQADYESLSLA